MVGAGIACFAVLACLSPPPSDAGGIPEYLVCHETVVRQLESGGVHSYQFILQAGEVFTLDAVDTSGTIELLRLRLFGPDGATLGSTCTGRLPMRAPADGVYILEVRDCIGNDAGQYSLTMNVVSDTVHSCAVPIACGVDVSGALEVGGQADSYAFYGAENEPVSLDFQSTLERRGGLEVRVFDPNGVAVLHSCGNTFDFNLPNTGRFTVLVNACLGKNTGEYDLAWRSRSCATHIGAHSSGGGVGLRLSDDGSQVLQIAASSLSCAYNDSSGFVVDLDPPATVTNGRFSTSVQALDQNMRSIQVDGVFGDLDRTQLLGGMSVLYGHARCNYQWAATSADDDDWDGWSDDFEDTLGSRPRGARSTPEDRRLPTTALFGPGVCRDRLDNDGDFNIDAADTACFGGQPATPSGFTAFAGRHSGAGAFSVERSADGTRITKLVATSLGCGSLEPRATAISVDIPIADNRFIARDVVVAGSSELAGLQVSVDGVFFDGDGDGTLEQALGGLLLRFGTPCRYKWWASAQLDTDGDGWGDVAERRYASDPRPFPSGLGMDSMPETASLPVTELNEVATCSDGLDNDGNHFADSADSKCPPPTPSPTATPTVTRTPTITPTPSASPTPSATHTPTSTAPPPATSTPVPPTATVPSTPTATAAMTGVVTATPTWTQFPTRTATRTLPPTVTPTSTTTPTTAPCTTAGAVRAARSAPAMFRAGAVVEVSLSIDVDETAVPNGAVITENLPPGWALESAEPPQSSANAATGELRWLFFGDQVVDRVITYRVMAPFNLNLATICGSSLYNDAGGIGRCVTTACSAIAAELTHPADGNADARIDDAELLVWIDRWTALQIENQDLLDTIDLWAAPCGDGALGCYCAEPAGEPRLFRPGRCDA